MTSKIVIKHTKIEINNYDMGDSIRLENYFTLYDPLCHTSYFRCLEYDENKRMLILPRGIDIYFLENTFQCNALVDKSCDKVKKIGPVMIKYLPRDDNQKEALRFTLGQGEYEFTKAKSQLSLNLNTGAGKTYIAITTIAWMQMRGMIITSSIGWLNQWKKCITDYTDITSDEICMISGAQSIRNLLHPRVDISKYKIFLASHNTIKSYGDSCGWDKVGELFKYLGIGIKIFDEAHLNLENLSMIDFHTDTYKTLYLTATPARSDKDENIIYKLYFKNIPSIDLFNEETDPRTAYEAIHFNSHPSYKDITKSKNAYGFNRNYYISYVVNTENFKRLLYIIINDIVLPCDGKVLIYIGTNESIQIVYDWINQRFPSLNGNVGIYTSIIEGNKKAQLDKKLILSTTKSCGAAVDIKGLKHTIVLAEPFKSEVLARQSLGRTRDRDTTYTEVVDEGFFFCKKYYTQKQKLFQKYATSCTDTRYQDDELIQRSNDIMESRGKMLIPIREVDKKSKCPIVITKKIDNSL